MAINAKKRAELRKDQQGGHFEHLMEETEMVFKVVLTKE